jgi:pimeloyl-ACP methyl ester carboxylesterase
MTRRLATVGCAIALLAAACGDDSAAPAPSTTTTTSTVAEDPSTTSEAPPTTSVAPSTTVAPAPIDGCTSEPAEMRTLVDDTRPTPATEQSAELPDRTIDVWIDVPAEPGPWPLLVFAHGLTGHARNHELHRTYLAEQCFVVIAPAFPLTNEDVPGGFLNVGDIEGQVGDVSFLIDQMLDDDGFAERIDSDRIGVIGHSLGGLTTAGAVLAADGDGRVSAAVVMSAGFGEIRDGVAVMLLHGDADATVPIASSIGAYGFVSGRGVFVTVLGGNHVAGIVDDFAGDYTPAVHSLTGAFFAHELDNLAQTVVEVADVDLALVSIEARTADGPLDDWADYFAS